MQNRIKQIAPASVQIGDNVRIAKSTHLASFTDLSAWSSRFAEVVYIDNSSPEEPSLHFSFRPGDCIVVNPDEWNEPILEKV